MTLLTAGLLPCRADQLLVARPIADNLGIGSGYIGGGIYVSGWLQFLWIKPLMEIEKNRRASLAGTENVISVQKTQNQYLMMEIELIR